MSQTATITRTVEGLDLPQAGSYELDAAHSQVGFVVRHLMVSKVRGRFGDFSGTVTIADRPEDSKVEVSVDLQSVDTRDARRDEHLRSADFFNADSNRTMTFVSTSVTHRRGDDWLVEGDLTIGATTKPLTLEVTYEGAAKDPWGGTRIGFSAKGEVDRDEFGISYNQALETGGVLIGRKVTIEIEAEAVLQ